jgi:hypothetical protein
VLLSGPPHLPSALLRACFSPPRDAGENEGGGLHDLNDWNVWNESAEDIDRGEILKLCSTEPLALLETRLRWVLAYCIVPDIADA